MLSRTAIKGIRKMPPKGGAPELAEVEVRRAVVVPPQKCAEEVS